jgi:hypothetical protein
MKSVQDANWGCDEEGLFDLLPSGIIKQEVDNTADTLLSRSSGIIVMLLNCVRTHSIRRKHE